jgi:hypothetical protein
MFPLGTIHRQLSLGKKITVFSPQNELLITIKPATDDDLPYGDLFIDGRDIKPQIITKFADEHYRCIILRAEVQGMLDDFFLAMVGKPEEDNCTFDIVMSRGLNGFPGIKVDRYYLGSAVLKHDVH